MGSRVKLTGEHFTHETLWGTAKRFLATEPPKERFYPLLAAVVFGYFAFEAYLNAALKVTNEKNNFIAQKKYRGPLGKFEYLAELCGHPIDKLREPFKTVRELSQVRNFLAHATIEPFDDIIPVEKLDEPQPHPPNYYAYVNPEFVVKALADVEALLNGLQVALVARFRDDDDIDMLQIGSDVGAFNAITDWSQAEFVEEKQPRMPNADKAGTKKVKS